MFALCRCADGCAGLFLHFFMLKSNHNNLYKFRQPVKSNRKTKPARRRPQHSALPHRRSLTWTMTNTMQRCRQGAGLALRMTRAPKSHVWLGKLD